MQKTYRITINDETEGVEYISLVDTPAIERNFVAFNAQKMQVSFNEELRIITTPVLIPNQKIFRVENGVEFYLVALKEDVEKIYLKFVKDNNFNKLNIMHTAGTDLTLTDANLIEIFLSDSRRGISAPAAFSDLSDMTWYVSYKINSDALWAEIKEGKFKGVSLEGNLGIVDFEDAEEIEYKEISELIEKIKKIIK